MSLEHLCPYFGLVLSCNIVFVAKCIRDKDIIRIILYTWLIIIIFLLPLPISHALFTWPLLTHSPFSRSLTLTFDVPPPHVTSHYRHHYPFVPRPYPKNISPSSTRPSQKWLKIFPIKMTTSVPPICHWRVNHTRNRWEWAYSGNPGLCHFLLSLWSLSNAWSDAP